MYIMNSASVSEVMGTILILCLKIDFLQIIVFSTTAEGAVTIAIGTTETTGLDREIDAIFGFLSNSETLVLLDSSSIDRESVSQIRFTVIATDSASQNTTADVTVVITDANDEIPVITNDGYKFSPQTKM